MAASASQRSPSSCPASSASAIAAAAARPTRADRPGASSAARRTWASGSSSRPRGEDRVRRLRIARQDLHGIAPDAGRRMLQARPTTASAAAGSDRRAHQAVQRPEGVDRAGVQADRVDRAIAHQLDQRGDDVASCRARPAAAGRAAARTGCRSRARRPALRRRSGRGRVGSSAVASVVDDPVDPAVGLVAERGLVGVALAGLEACAASGCAGRCSCTSR